ncbi:MAG: S-ribosylhomocysteine lyase [Holosporaceae bacterium]|jgi:S-ribosylhomocysteine lyase|nr:S-ribosylhomocysteine lyase [Holosporaceae bacterium]
MNKIKSFEVDHDKLEKGAYISRIDGDIFTYDIRMIKPNTPPYIKVPAAHTIEHIFATFARDKYPENIIYVGPMGCRTGFYLLTRDLPHEKALELIKESMKLISEFEGAIPGATRKECGNYLEHDLEKAKSYARDMVEVLRDWRVEDLDY